MKQKLLSIMMVCLILQSMLLSCKPRQTRPNSRPQASSDAAANSDLITEQNLPTELAFLQSFMDVGLEEGSSAADTETKEREVRRVALDVLLGKVGTEQADKKTKLMANLLLMGNRGELYYELTKLFSLLSFEGDKYRYTLRFSASPLPTIRTKDGVVTINAGLLGFVRNIDELAAVVSTAIAMENDVRNKSAGKDESLVKRFLGKFDLYQNEKVAHQEVIRADLHAIDRMVKAGFNPNAFDAIFARIGRWYRGVFDVWVTRHVWRRIFSADYNYIQDMPLFNIRSASVSSYLAFKGGQEDVFDATTKPYTPFSRGMRILKWRLYLYNVNISNKWARRTVMPTALYAAINASILSNTVFFDHYMRVFENKLSEQWRVVNTQVDHLWQRMGRLDFQSAEAIAERTHESRISDTAPILNTYDIGQDIQARAMHELSVSVNLGVRDFVESLVVPVRKAIWDPLKEHAINPAMEHVATPVASAAGNGWDIAWGATIDYGMPILGTSILAGIGLIVLYAPIYMHNEILRVGNVYDDLQKMKIVSKRVIRAASAYYHLHQNKFDTEKEARYLRLLIAQTVRTMAMAQTISRKSNTAHYFRFTDGIRRTRRSMELTFGHAMAEFERLHRQHGNDAAIKTLRPQIMEILQKLPAYAFEDRSLRHSINTVLERVYGTSILQQRPAVKEILERAENSPERRLALSSYRFEPAYFTALSAADKLRVIDALMREGQIDSGEKLLRRHYQAIRKFVFSTANSEPKLATLFTEVTHIAKNQGSWQGKRYTRWKKGWDRRLAIARMAEKFNDTIRGTSIPQTGGISANRSEQVTKRWFQWDWITIRAWIDLQDHKNLQKAFATFASLNDLKNYVETEMITRNVIMDRVTSDFFAVIQRHPEWLTTKADFDRFLEMDYLWPKMGGNGAGEAGSMQANFAKIVNKLAEKYPEVWRYSPSASEANHRLLITHLKKINAFPDSYEGKLELWQKLCNRGITSETDRLFSTLYDSANPTQRTYLETQPEKGRILEPQLRAKITRQKILRSPSYQLLLTSAQVAERSAALEKVIEIALNDFPERGNLYQDLMEHVSEEIESTPQESSRIEDSKRVESKSAEEFGLRALEDVLKEAGNWRKKHQWDLIKFLRGDIAATAKINDAFSIIGPERVRRMFQVLPNTARVGVFFTFLIGDNGLLSSRNFKSGWAKTIITHTIRGGTREEMTTAREVLDGMLHALKASGQAGFRTAILAHLLAKGEGNSTPVETVKQVLEMRSSLIKLGQQLAIANIFGDKTKALRDLQSNANPPEREQRYQEIRDQTGGRDIPGVMGKLMGSASMKWATLFKLPASLPEVVIKELRPEAKNQNRQEFAMLDYFSTYMVKKYGVNKYGVLRGLVNAAKADTQLELKLARERSRADIARNHLYRDASDHAFSIFVPKNVILAERLMAEQVAHGVNIEDLPVSLQEVVARRIIAIERRIYQGKMERQGSTTLQYDKDNHPGQWKVFLKDGELVAVRTHLGERDSKLPLNEAADVLSRFDHGLGTSIEFKDINRVKNIFALAQILIEAGPTQWVSDKAAVEFEFTAEQKTRFQTALKKYFPNKGMMEIIGYYSVLSAAYDSGYKGESLAPFYAYVRGIYTNSDWLKFIPKEKRDSVKSCVSDFADDVETRARTYETLLRKEITAADSARVLLNNPMDTLKGACRNLRNTLNQ